MWPIAGCQTQPTACVNRMPVHSDPNTHSGMEALNAVTMLPPPIILMWRAQQAQCSPYGLLAFAAIACQVPFAVAYHMSESIRIRHGREGCRIDNDWRRADQTAQHVAQVALTYAVTRSLPYTLMAVVWPHGLAIVRLWHRSTSNDGRRWTMIAAGVAVYTLPMLRTSALFFAYAVVPMAIGSGVAFVPSLSVRGGHPIMHVLSWLHADAIGQYIAHVDLQ